MKDVIDEALGAYLKIEESNLYQIKGGVR